MTAIKSFQTVYSVPLECGACVESVREVLSPLKGIEKFDIDLTNQRVTVEGTCPPSAVVSTLRASGKDAIIRGTGQPNSAAVCILESFAKEDKDHPVKGLARIVSVGTDLCMVDLTINGLPKGKYFPSIRANGNISQGAMSTGPSYFKFPSVDVFTKASSETTIASIGASTHTDSVQVYSGQAFLPAALEVTDLIGRSMVLSTTEDGSSATDLVGVIARSAGVWENDKAVCSCSGKTVWEERKDALDKGVM
ncbi:hypothetical protein BABINDRAFT_170359 [Babjeviella inositovora NRRL Y-12698]|uniref:Superoxide dismutase 1 copper chaperone n=1 Tax=Babjeviella inositovora NRRL Y-12698 TaxID=984486 RepID=A0A1E3QVF4_9ASCO|nr:uncharacterized protein BABINDRAFT_170359 [Babjeviella inositovora NRRL Y-12698]ODQ81645.1 hypothetical protein BABINDRAFT_170359 [Babjeviella inositovora NRRL Y-12698]